MSKKGDLEGQTIVFTGQPKSDEAILEVRRLGGEVQIFPLLQTTEVSLQDEKFITQLNAYDWLIFTSQNAVATFEQKLIRHRIQKKNYRFKIAAVGSKTALAIEKLGFHVTFIPTSYSADDFVQQFPQISNQSDACLFLKGSLAKATIQEGLPQLVDEWTVYETCQDANNTQRLSTYLARHKNTFIAFASPSSVEIFTRHIASTMGWDQFKIAAIGHVTAAALQKQGAPVHVQSTTYTWLALVQEIANWKDESNKW